MTKRPSSRPGIKEYNARAGCDEGALDDMFEVAITKAILRGNEIIIEWPEYYGHTTHTKLTTTAGSTYSGESIWGAHSEEEETAVVDAVLYSNEQGHVLVGEEHWSSGDCDWFVVQFFERTD
jgi:hypothetical protein